MSTTGSSARCDARTAWILFGLAALAAAFTLGLRPVLGDEFGSIWLAATENCAGILHKIRMEDVHPPTHYLFLHAWGMVFGYGDVAMRWPSLLFTALSIAVASKIAVVWLRKEDSDRSLPLFLIATAPAVWVMGITARYYSAGALLGLVATLAYLRWLREGGVVRWWQWVGALVAACYLHYLLAVALLCSQAAHVWATVGVRGPKQKALHWLAAQATVAAFAAPVLAWSLWPLLAGESQAGASSAREGLSGLAAFPFVLAGHVFAMLTGGVPFPWQVAVVAPVCLAGGVGLWFWFRGASRQESLDVLWLVAFPFALAALAVAVLLPAAGYFRGLLRAGYLPVLGWLVVIRGISFLAPPRRAGVVVLVLVSNVAGLWLLFANRPSMVQDHPVKEIIRYISAASVAGQGLAVVHPFEHGWGDAVARYEPSWRTRVLVDSDPAEVVQEVGAALVRQPSEDMWIIRQNRFGKNADALAGLLVEHGYVCFDARDFQPQSAFDLRVKEWIKSISALGFRSEPSYPHILTVQGFRRESP